MLFIYARVSTIEQAQDGAASLPEQMRKGRALAQMRGVSSADIAECVDEGVSGSVHLLDRPAGKDMIKSLRRGDCVVAAKLDRLFRSALDALYTIDDLAKRGVDLVLLDISTEPVTANGVGKLFFGILSLMAEFERDRIRERTEEGREAKRARKGYTGGHAPFGFQVVGVGRDARLEEKPEEKKIAEVVKTMSRDGHKPGRVAMYLSKYHPTRSGKPWQQVQVERILKHG